MKGMVSRAALTALALFGYSVANTTHEIISPLISGPMAAQQLNDSNAAYVGTQVVARTFNGSGFGNGIVGLVLVAVLVLIWWTPVKSLFMSKENNGNA